MNTIYSGCGGRRLLRFIAIAGVCHAPHAAAHCPSKRMKQLTRGMNSLGPQKQGLVGNIAPPRNQLQLHGQRWWRDCQRRPSTKATLRGQCTDGFR